MGFAKKLKKKLSHPCRFRAPSFDVTVEQALDASRPAQA
jgi:hypothetical protein